MQMHVFILAVIIALGYNDASKIKPNSKKNMKKNTRDDFILTITESVEKRTTQIKTNNISEETANNNIFKHIYKKDAFGAND